MISINIHFLTSFLITPKLLQITPNLPAKNIDLTNVPIVNLNSADKHVVIAFDLARGNSFRTSTDPYGDDNWDADWILTKCWKTSGPINVTLKVWYGERFTDNESRGGNAVVSISKHLQTAINHLLLSGNNGYAVNKNSFQPGNY